MALDLDSIADGPIMPGRQGGATPDEPIRSATPPAAAEPEATEPDSEKTPKQAASEPEDEPLVAPPALELDDEAEIKIGNDTYKVKDLRDGQLMRADYTRKTEAIARERQEMSNFRLEKELEGIQTEDFLRRMDDPNELINEFAAHKPEVWEAVEQYIIDRAVHLQGLTAEGRELYLHKEGLSRKAWQEARDKRMEQTFNGHKTKAQQRAEAQKNHGNWRSEAMKAAGLGEKHHELVMDGMTSARNRGKAWTKELFDAEAARVAKTLGVKAPKPAKVEDRKSTRLNSSHGLLSRMPSSACKNKKL